MRRPGWYNAGTWTTGNDKATTVRTWVKVDYDAIVRATLRRARKSKTGRATALGGGIVIELQAVQQEPKT